MIIPYWLLRTRKYALQVYIYAINLYSTESGISQRRVAEEVRKKFDLKTFSHSTVCRVFKALEKDLLCELKGDTDDGDTVEGASAHPDVVDISAAEIDKGKEVEIDRTRRFPSVVDNAERRSRMAAFLKELQGNIETVCINEVCQAIVRNWYGKCQRLLL